MSAETTSQPETETAAGTVSVVMPAYNEAPRIAECIGRVLRQPVVAELIVIDDGSTDGTADVVAGLAARDNRLRLERHPCNLGKGAALRTGLAQAGGGILIVQDADLEYDPEDYAAALRPILAGRADVVFGTRFLGGEHRVLYFWHRVGNFVITLLSNCFTNLNLSDVETGMKILRREVAARLDIEEKRFGVEPEIAAKVAALGVRVYEVPISYHGRTYAEGKKIGWRDGVVAVWCILKYGFRRWLAPAPDAAAGRVETG